MKTPADAGESSIPDTGPVIQPMPDAGTAPGPEDASEPACPGRPIALSTGPTFCTIAEAVAAAPEGATVLIPPGKYVETVHVVTRNLTIMAGGTVTLAGNGTDIPLRLNADGVKAKLFNVEALNTIGVEITANATLEDMTITNSVGAGVWVTGAGLTATLTRVNIRGTRCANQCTSMDYGEGLVALADTTVNFVSGEISENDYTGIWSDGATVKVEASLIRANGRAKCRQDPGLCLQGISAINNSLITVERMSRIAESGGSGIMIWGGAQLTMRNSASVDNGIRNEAYSDGITLSGNRATLEANNISNNLGFGVGCVEIIQVSSCTTNDINGNNAGPIINCTGC